MPVGNVYVIHVTEKETEIHFNTNASIDLKVGLLLVFVPQNYDDNKYKEMVKKAQSMRIRS